MRKPLVPADVLPAEPTYFTQLAVFHLQVLDKYTPQISDQIRLSDKS